jgi:hypothetical protein
MKTAIIGLILVSISNIAVASSTQFEVQYRMTCGNDVSLRTNPSIVCEDEPVKGGIDKRLLSANQNYAPDNLTSNISAIKKYYGVGNQ